MKRFRLVLALLPVALPLSAQENGAVTGRVMADGSALASAQVVLAQSVTGAQYGDITNDSGRYNVVGVPPGTYDVSVELIGYRGQTQQITVVAGGTEVVDRWERVNGW